MPGRPPKTKRKLKLERGELYGKTKMRPDISQKTEEKPVMPVRFNDEQHMIWDRIQEILEKYNLCNLANEIILELLVHNIFEYRSLTVMLEDEGHMLEDKINPLFTARQKAGDNIIKYCDRLGLSSAGLARLGCLTIEKKEDELEELMD
jgi:P27 family predicted phage terminase small subunit